MKTKMKALTLVLCAMLLVVSTVFTTVAFLTSTDTVQNTFTVGKVEITLDEAKVDTAGNIEAGEDRDSSEGRVKANVYHLIPAHNYVKDPTVHVASDSEPCLLFVKLENGLKNIIAATTIEDQMEAYGWVEIDADNGIWAYSEVAEANGHYYVFDEFKLTDDAEVSGYALAVINVTAYAVQADGFVDDIEAGAPVSATEALDAWDAADFE